MEAITAVRLKFKTLIGDDLTEFVVATDDKKIFWRYNNNGVAEGVTIATGQLSSRIARLPNTRSVEYVREVVSVETFVPMSEVLEVRLKTMDRYPATEEDYQKYTNGENGKAE